MKPKLEKLHLPIIIPLPDQSCLFPQVFHEHFEVQPPEEAKWVECKDLLRTPHKATLCRRYYQLGYLFVSEIEDLDFDSAVAVAEKGSHGTLAFTKAFQHFACARKPLNQIPIQ